MRNYRRASISGGRSVFTVVAYRRRPLMTHSASREALRGAIEQVRRRRPFAWMHGSCHPITSTASGRFRRGLGFLQPLGPHQSGFYEANKISFLGGRIAERIETHRDSSPGSRPYSREGSGSVRSATKMNADNMWLIHCNLIKHGHVGRVADRPWLTFRRYVESGKPPEHWAE